MIRGGEARLHRLGALVGNQLFSSNYDLKSVVVGETVVANALRIRAVHSHGNNVRRN